MTIPFFQLGRVVPHYQMAGMVAYNPQVMASSVFSSTPMLQTPVAFPLTIVTTASSTLWMEGEALLVGGSACTAWRPSTWNCLLGGPAVYSCLKHLAHWTLCLSMSNGRSLAFKWPLTSSVRLLTYLCLYLLRKALVLHDGIGHGSQQACQHNSVNLLRVSWVVHKKMNTHGFVLMNS